MLKHKASRQKIQAKYIMQPNTKQYAADLNQDTSYQFW